MLVRLPDAASRTALAALPAPLLGLSGVCFCGLGPGPRLLLAALLLGRLCQVWRRWRRPRQALVVAPAAAGMVCWRGADGAGIAWPHAATRITPRRLVVALPGHPWLPVHAGAGEAGRRALARQLQRRPPPAPWRPLVPPCGRPWSRVRIGYNRALRAPRPAPCPPS